MKRPPKRLCAQCRTVLDEGYYCTPCRWSPELGEADTLEPSAGRWGGGLGIAGDGTPMTDYVQPENK